jgi:four helix bundle protein
MYKFERLEVWKLSLEYHDYIYEVCDMLPDFEKFNLTSQFARAATSICLNIAEGSTCSTNKEQKQFLKTAIHSYIETIAANRMAKRKGYLESYKNLKAMESLGHTLFMKLIRFRNSLG